MDQFGQQVQAALIVSPGVSGTLSGSGGTYSLGVPVGTRTVSASKAFYSSHSVSNVAVNEGQTTIVNFVIGILCMLELAKVFGQSTGFGVGLILLGPIFICILGFGGAQYSGPGAAAAAPPVASGDEWPSVKRRT